MGRQGDSSVLLEYMREEGHMKEGMRHKILTPCVKQTPPVSSLLI